MKHQSLFTRTHGVINQKTRISIFNVCALLWKTGLLSIEKFAGEFK